MSKFYYEMTSYHRIFKNTYWGNFKVRDDEDLSEIFKNRNEFVEKYGIISGQAEWSKKNANVATALKNSKFKECFDHCEFYRTNYDLVVITSPYVYVGERENLVTAKLCKLGFIVLPPIYHPNAKTFLRRFTKMMDVKKFLKFAGTTVRV
jgi:hypothetical protein